MKKRHLIVPILTLFLTSNVYAITSNDVTYDNEGTTENLTTTLDNLNSELKKYKTGGSVEANQMLEGATGYSKGELVTGTIKSKAAQTYTPGTSNQTIDAGVYLSGAQTIKGDANLTAANIAKGKSIFGVSGTYTSDANATAGNILSGKTAYVNGSKVTGTIASKGATTYTPGTSNQTINAGQYLSGAQTIKGDANLTAANIAKGKSIFGVSGTYTSDANATAAAILSGYTAYVNGSKVTGSIIDMSGDAGTDGLALATGKLEMNANQLRLGIKPGYYGSLNYVNFGTPGVVINNFFNVYAESAVTVGSASDCGSVVTLSHDIPAGSYLVFAATGKSDGTNNDAMLDFYSPWCDSQVCSGLSVTTLAKALGGKINISIYIVNVDRARTKGTGLMRVQSNTCSYAGPFDVVYEWVKLA